MAVSRLCLVLALAAAFLSFAPSPAPAAETREMYLSALREFKRLAGDPKFGKRRDRWQSVEERFVAVYRANPKGPLAPKALFYRAWARESMADRSFLESDYGAAADLYKTMADVFPTHVWADDAVLRRAALLARKLKKPAEAKAELLGLLKYHASGDKAAEARALLASLDPGAAPPGLAVPAPSPSEVRAPAGPAGPAGRPAASAKDPAVLSAIELTRSGSGARATLVLDRETTYRYQLLGRAPEGKSVSRLYIDLENTRLGDAVPALTTPKGLAVRRVRAAYNKPDVVRVVLDVEDLGAHHVFTLDKPFRVALEVNGPAAAATKAGSAQVREAVAPPGGAVPEPPGRLFETRAEAGKARPDGSAAGDKEARSVVRDKKGPEPPAEVTRKAEPAEAARQAASRPEYKPSEAGRKRIGDLVEQLGLTVRAIMIDPGHGGKDPGARGPTGVVEKDVNLRFARVLGQMLKEHGFEVLYTRTRDVFVPLEDRTAMANDKKADLFVSIHCNSHGDPNSRGLEVYSLNLAQSDDAVRVAARENAVSEKRISDLQVILTDLMLSSKIKESRDLAKGVQSEALTALTRKKLKPRDRGAHEAPFYVLMGARMPAVLVELGYLTNAAEARDLTSDSYLKTLAEGLTAGVIGYKKRIERYTGK